MMESGARYNDMSVTVVMAHQKARNCVMYVLGLYDLSYLSLAHLRVYTILKFELLCRAIRVDTYVSIHVDESKNNQNQSNSVSLSIIFIFSAKEH